jgi:hypothetical protein
MKRDASQVIWRTVVFAGAMLGAPACKSKQANTTPSNTAVQKPADQGSGAQGSAMTAEPAPDQGDANPCGGGPAPRPRGTDDGNTGGGMGRGFVLS